MNNPLAGDEPQRSGVDAVIKAADAITAATTVRSDRERDLQNAVDDIRTWCHGKKVVSTEGILNIIGSHHV